jgi:hypothetical protein
MSTRQSKDTKVKFFIFCLNNIQGFIVIYSFIELTSLTPTQSQNVIFAINLD